jgi:hypothetical protein
MQKNDQKHDTDIHGRTDDLVLYPVLQWECLDNQIWTYLALWRILQSARLGAITDLNR